jgi:hypothetical protein
MSPYEQSQELRRRVLPQLAARKSDLHRLLEHGPSTEADDKLIFSVVAFALASVSCFEGEQVLPPAGNKN